MALPQPPAPVGSTACYRHPDRETGRRCTRCGRPACAECLVAAPVGSHCVECAKSDRPNLRTRARWAQARQPILVTYAIMAANVAVFLWVSAQDANSLSGGGRVSLQELELGLNREIIARTGEWYRIVTSGFLHFGIAHLALNMLLLWQLGMLLEPQIGRLRFGLVYFAGLLGGSAMALFVQPNGLHGGASGAIFGLVGFAALSLHQRGINPFTTGIGTLLLLNLALTFGIRGISWGGHVGGLIAGVICAAFVTSPRRRPAWLTISAPVVVMIVAGVACVVAVKT